MDPGPSARAGAVARERFVSRAQRSLEAMEAAVRCSDSSHLAGRAGSAVDDAVAAAEVADLRVAAEVTELPLPSTDSLTVAWMVTLSPSPVTFTAAQVPVSVSWSRLP